jgi:peptidoglycan/xylan/chitin deacetylase (PgdA/CDA1 family)
VAACSAIQLPSPDGPAATPSALTIVVAQPTTTATLPPTPSATATSIPPTTTRPPTATVPPATATPTQNPSPTGTRVPPTTTPTRVLPTATVPPPTVGGPGGQPPPEIALGNPAKRRIALTFDAGASAEPLPKILAALRQAGVQSTFFLTGAWAAENPAGVKAIIADGHDIANHSNTHPDFTTISDAEIVKELQTTEEIVQKIAGRTTKPYFRPPFGARDKRVLAAAWAAGYRAVYWTVDSGDWREDATVEGVVTTILKNASNGAIFIEHVGSPQTAEGLPRIIAGLRDKGFELVPLSVVVQ